jgi:dihydrofolate synthase / folylpolyglutamate synthase
MQITAVKTRIFKANEDLSEFIRVHVPHLPEKCILLVTSKILALAQGRVVPVAGTSKKELVKKEADKVLCESYKTYLTIKDGILIPAAGIDESNAENSYILWPAEPFEEARKLWISLRDFYKVKELGIIFTDSRCTPLRKGVTGIGIAHWGFKGIASHIGKPDLFGRPLVMSMTNVVDALSAAAVLLMGESNESCPLAVARGFQAEFCEKTDPKELLIPTAEDIFGPVIKF